MFLEFFISSPKAVHIFRQGSRILKKQSVFRAIAVSTNYMLTFSQKRENRPCSFFKTRVRYLWRGILDKNGIEQIYIKPRDALQTSRWTDTPYAIPRVIQVIVSDMPLHRTVCCYIVPGAAKLSSVCGDRVQVIP